MTLQPTEKYLRTKIDALMEKIDMVVKRHYVQAEDAGDVTIDLCGECGMEFPCETYLILTS